MHEPRQPAVRRVRFDGVEVPTPLSSGGVRFSDPVVVVNGVKIRPILPKPASISIVDIFGGTLAFNVSFGYFAAKTSGRVVG